MVNLALCWYNDIPYYPIKPEADSDELARRGSRLMIRHSTKNLEVLVAPKGVLYGGWVIGLLKEGLEP